MPAAGTTAEVAAKVAEFARAKINLALHVLGRRADGYHELDSIVAFADVGDQLTFTPAAQFSISASGPFAAQLPPYTDNIVHRAWAALGVPPVAIAIEKNLPVSSGMGGGSANAAAALRALTRINKLALPAPDLHALALSLGADVPVCMKSKACRMRGMGERLEPLADFAPLHAVLVNPGVAVPTAEIFRSMAIEQGTAHGAAITSMIITSWRNDMTDAALKLAPQIAGALEKLHQQPGLITARMSGSGATCFGIFESREDAKTAAIALSRPSWWTVATALT